MPKVSILIPAFRPTFLDLSISSALSQSDPDFELIISDDSEGTDVESVVSKWVDPRIRYLKNPNRGSTGANRDHLISLASGRYLKFLHDDDLLMPEALARMTAAAEALGAALVFTGWYVVDQSGRPCDSNRFAEAGEERLLSAEEFFEAVIAESDNFIGGPSNILVDSEALATIANPFSLDDLRLRYLTDVALFANVVHRGLRVAAVGTFGSAYRRHDGQYSGPEGSAGSAALVEWELLLRWSAEHGHLTSERYWTAVAPDKRQYLDWIDRYPELAGVIELAGRRGPDGRYLSDEFIAAVRAVHDEVDARLARREPAEELAPLEWHERRRLGELEDRVAALVCERAEALEARSQAEAAVERIQSDWAVQQAAWTSDRQMILEARNREAAAFEARLQDLYEEFHRSTSWRVTRPLRALSGAARRMRQRLGAGHPTTDG